MPFRFRLEKVLEWQQARSDLEESKLKQLNATLEKLIQSLAMLRATRTAAELEVRALDTLRGADLAALSSYRTYLEHCESSLIREHDSCRQRRDQQRDIWAETHRRLRLLEKLKARRLAAFEFESNRELEKVAAELFLIRGASS